jgi:hypothetical protein
MVGHFLFDDQLVLGFDRDLNVVADGDTRGFTGTIRPVTSQSNR